MIEMEQYTHDWDESKLIDTVNGNFTYRQWCGREVERIRFGGRAAYVRESVRTDLENEKDTTFISIWGEVLVPGKNCK